ncbi:MAG: tRNA uridine-5-carboxymethylaminomethyl(34) synthesis GTPase MnmE [Oscillospiraceae bacterium]|nr:tRNA uridine-5-carboxymethylaminomethyl(34) synthesis GTPase MnmE [Ruminococcus sp.]MCD8344395.1 tRNA uridine-5-carboxymethylaminomethyl(34) synthesis GTPase MnmE [Oscillospiraceae bacterium]
MSTTIAAISTPVYQGGLAVIRMSGEDSIRIADNIFVGKTAPSSMAGYTCQYGKIVREGRTLDDVILTVFRGPHSYTGEDTVEVSCHGGVYLAREILKLMIEEGAEPAPAGEFTKRAFLSGKLSLTQAEGVLDIISANGERELVSARAMRDGNLGKNIHAVADDMVKISGNLAAWSDYPDEDIPDADTSHLAEDLSDIINRLEHILSSYDKGKILRQGIDTAIVGRPNVGKSTLMNQLLGYKRSIVTENAGTTRDVIEESVRVGDFVLKLSDTAGIRDTQDPIECIGVDLATQKLENAELVLAVFDSSEELTETDLEILEKIRNKPHIVLLNKSDLPEKLDSKYFSGENILSVSANSGLGLEKLPEMIAELFKLGGSTDTAEIYINERQRSQVSKSLGFVRLALQEYESGMTLDAVTVYLDEALGALLELTGERATEAVVNDLFERFCVGK